MRSVQHHPIPADTALYAFSQKRGYYTDCFAVEIDRVVAFSDFIEAFYTTRLFRAERLLLRIFAAAPSSDLEARQLGLGLTERFAIWRTEERTETQLLMKAIGRTRSWFMIEKASERDLTTTRLLFGSVVAPMQDGEQAPKIGFLFTVFHGVHLLYSKLLLSAALRRLKESS